MSVVYWILTGLLAVAASLCLWGWLTGGPGPDRRHEDVRKPGRRKPEQDTQRLMGRPMHPGEHWVPPWERPGGPAVPPPDWPPSRGLE